MAKLHRIKATKKEIVDGRHLVHVNVCGERFVAEVTRETWLKVLIK